MPKTAASRVPFTVPIRSDAAVTIGKLARAAEVGVETVRYYQRRRLLPVPHTAGGVRRYPAAMIDRIRFIKRSQDLGFSLEEIRELMRLEQGGSRSAIRKIAGDRLANIREKIAALGQMERVLSELLRTCEHTVSAAPCPIIAALSTNPTAARHSNSDNLRQDCNKR
jgi:MerR family mercuric resistance operon transcriptional regulator